MQSAESSAASMITVRVSVAVLPQVGVGVSNVDY